MHILIFAINEFNIALLLFLIGCIYTMILFSFYRKLRKRQTFLINLFISIGLGLTAIYLIENDLYVYKGKNPSNALFCPLIFLILFRLSRFIMQKAYDKEFVISYSKLNKDPGDYYNWLDQVLTMVCLAGSFIIGIVVM